jgi:hypothetical protein
LNKKLQKGLVAAVAATLSTGIVAPVYAASVETKSFDAQYAEAYNATVNAKTQKELTAARVLVDKLYADLPQDLKNLAATLSALLDPKQQTELVKLDKAIKLAEVSGKQADVNAAKALIVDMPEVWMKSFSSYMDGIQQPIMVKALEAAKKAQVSGLQVDFDAAKVAYDEIALVTNNDGVKSWVETALKAELDKVELLLLVNGVSAVNASTLTISGQGLGKLAKTDITIVGNAVTTLTASADGKTATVTLEGKLSPNSQTTVAVKDSKESKDYTVSNGYVVSTVTINTAAFDEDRANQSVSFRVNSESVNADLDYLALAGYSVTFVAVDSDNVAAPIFDNGAGGSSNTSTTGKLASGLAVGDYKIEAQVVGNGVTVVSNKATITITNLDADVAAINTVTFVNGGTDSTYDSAYYNSAVDALSATDFEMVSKTLVAGEKVGVYKVDATIGGVKSTLIDADFSVKSSNVAAVSVANIGTSANPIYVLTAESAGTATITVTAGKATTSYTFTVTNTARKVASVVPSKSRVDLVDANPTAVKVGLNTYDQYGDPIAIVSGTTAAAAAGTIAVDEVIPNGKLGTALVTGFDVATTTTDSIGYYSQTITPAAGNTGSGTVYFKDKNGVVLGSLIVNVSSVNNVSTSTLKIVTGTGRSSDNNLDFQNGDDSVVRYGIAKYNSEGIFVGYQDLSGYTIEVLDPTVVTASTLDSTGASSVAGLAGRRITTGIVGSMYINLTAQNISTASKSTSVVVRDASGNIIPNSFVVAVANVPFKISAVQFKTVPTIDYVGKQLKAGDVLSLTESNGDDIVSGITLNKTTSSKVRIAQAANAGIAIDDLYLDLDNNGLASAGDVKLGTVVVSATSDSNAALLGKVAVTGVGYVTSGLTSTATASLDKGTLLVKVQTNVADPTTSIAGTAITINVK